VIRRRKKRFRPPMGMVTLPSMGWLGGDGNVQASREGGRQSGGETSRTNYRKLALTEKLQGYVVQTPKSRAGKIYLGSTKNRGGNISIQSLHPAQEGVVRRCSKPAKLKKKKSEREEVVLFKIVFRKQQLKKASKEGEK